ncbi:MAG: hypothetical protein IJZ76_05920 [Lachnospiraceae bacterium]|nr:hypothetical protein [Lachnospiraceae bacterium]
MSETATIKENFLELFKQLTYEYQRIVIDTFKSLATYEELPPKGYKPFDIANLINQRQKELNLSDSDVCNRVNDILYSEDYEEDATLSTDTYYKIKQRNTQTSKKKLNLLAFIAQALEIDEKEFKKYLTEEGLERATNLVSKYSDQVNSIDKLYDLLSAKERSAMLQLTTALLRLQNAPEYNTEHLEIEE